MARFRGVVFLVVLLALISGPLLAQNGDRGVRVTPAVALPLGDDAQFFAPGAAASVQMYASPGALPWFSPALTTGYAIHGLEIDTSLSLLNAGADLALIGGGSTSFGIAAGGGYYYGLLNNGTTPRSGGGYVDARTIAGVDLSPRFTLSVEVGYRNYLGLSQMLTIGFGGITHRAMPELQIQQGPVISPPRPLDEARQAEILRISAASFSEVFPVFFKYYDEHAIGSARILNRSEEPVENLSIQFTVGQFMDTPTSCQAPRRLAAGDSADIEIGAFFNDTVLDITEATKVSGQLTVSFKHDGIDYTRSYTQTLRLHDRNSMTWDDDRKAAAFVTARDPAVLTIAKNVSSVVTSGQQSPIPAPLRLSMAMHEAIRLYGMSYTPDPDSPYRNQDSNDLRIDYLQFPRQTLQYRGGDCDDLTILFCSLLQALGVDTAFVLVPGHIFAAVNSGLSSEEARRQFTNVDDLIFQGGSAWIPVEVTLLSADFLSAWDSAAGQWREAEARELAELIPCSDAWRVYEPVGLRGEGQSLPPLDLEEVASEYRDQLATYVDRTIYPVVAQLQQEIQETNGAPRAVNRLAVLYARYGLYERAAAQFQSLLEARPDYVPAIVNLGNIHLLTGNLTAADRSFERALELDSDNPQILISAARVNHQLQNYGSARQYYRRARDLDPALAAQFAYLDLQGDEAVRAAERSGSATTMLWAEEE